jgi:DNA-binding NarL/FixJ family response regulator
VFNTALCFREIGDIRCRMGDLEGADQAYERAADLGLAPQPGLALLRLAQGRTTVAAAMTVQALGEKSWNRLERAKLLPAAVRIALAVHDPVTARESAEELGAIAARYRSCGIEAAALTARGRIELAEGDPLAACSTLRNALQQWQELDVPYEAATVRVLLASAMRAAGDDDAGEAFLASARSTFERLGAKLDLAATERLGRSDRPYPDGLTGREVEVLQLVAAGQSNKAIARQLSLSEKTVARHLSNIFRKLDVASRSAATAYAFENGLVGNSR